MVDIGADILERKDKDAGIKLGFSIAGILIGDGFKKLPIPDPSKQVADTYLGRGIGAIKDGYFDNRPPVIKESSKLNLSIEYKK